MTNSFTSEEIDALDFEQWSGLAKQDPDTFEAMRLAVIEDAIASAPKDRQQRMRCLQWRIDQERRLSYSPIGACIRISQMMWENLMGDDGMVEQIDYLSKPAKNGIPDQKPRHHATIIPFRPK